jgi:hypothetical protein
MHTDDFVFRDTENESMSCIQVTLLCCTGNAWCNGIIHRSWLPEERMRLSRVAKLITIIENKPSVVKKILSGWSDSSTERTKQS